MGATRPGSSVGIVGSRLSREVQRVREELGRRGARVALIDLSGFPGVHRASIGSELRGGGGSVSEAAVWLLRQAEAELPPYPGMTDADVGLVRSDVSEALLCRREVRAFLESFFWSAASCRRVVNRPEAASLHGRKPLMIALLRRAGVPVPESLTTTDRASAAAFVEEHAGEVVCKTASGGGVTELAAALLERTPLGVGLRGPLLFQRRIIGRSLRAYVVHGRVVGCCEVLHGDVVDWRTDQRGLRPWGTDAALGAILTRSCAALQMDYAGIDVELDGHDEPFVLDVNSAPMFASYERSSGHDVAGPIADMLVALSREPGAGDHGAR
jgi:hypothetical protein